MTYPISDLLELVKGLVLWTNTPKISKTGDSYRISQRSSNEDPVMVVYQKPEVLNKTRDALQ